MEVKDIELKILVSIRDEIKALQTDVNVRFERMDKRFKRIEEDISRIKKGMDYIVSRFKRDYLLLASEADTVKRRFGVCEERLGISPDTIHSIDDTLEGLLTGHGSL